MEGARENSGSGREYSHLARQVGVIVSGWSANGKARVATGDLVYSDGWPGAGLAIVEEEPCFRDMRRTVRRVT